MELKRCAMVLEGGAVKGIFTSGVLDYLMKRDFYPEYVVGVSAGACNAVDYVSKQPGRTRDCFITRRPDERYLRFSNVFRHRPVYDMDMVFDQFPNKSHPFDFDTFYRSPMKCEMVVTNCLTGKAEYKTPDPDKKKRFMDTCRASSSMPFVSPLVMLDHVPYLDGGIADSVLLLRGRSSWGYEKIVVVLTKNRGYRKGAQPHVYENGGLRVPEIPEAVPDHCQTLCGLQPYHGAAGKAGGGRKDFCHPAENEGHRADGAGSEEAGGVLRGRLPPHGESSTRPCANIWKNSKSPFQQKKFW